MSLLLGCILFLNDLDRFSDGSLRFNLFQVMQSLSSFNVFCLVGLGHVIGFQFFFVLLNFPFIVFIILIFYILFVSVIFVFVVALSVKLVLDSFSIILVFDVFPEHDSLRPVD